MIWFSNHSSSFESLVNSECCRRVSLWEEHKVKPWLCTAPSSSSRLSLWYENATREEGRMFFIYIFDLHLIFIPWIEFKARLKKIRLIKHWTVINLCHCTCTHCRGQPHLRPQTGWKLKFKKSKKKDVLLSDVNNKQTNKQISWESWRMYTKRWVLTDTQWSVLVISTLIIMK